MNFAQTIKILALLVVAQVALASANSECETLVANVRAKGQKSPSEPLSNWDKHYELAMESLASNRITDLDTLTKCMDFYEKAYQMDRVRQRSEDRMRNLQFKVRQAEDLTRMRQAQAEAAELVNEYRLNPLVNDD